MSNASQPNCSNQSLSYDERRVCIAIASSGGFAGVLSCSTALALLVFFKMYKHFSERLSLYLLLSGLFAASVLCIQIVGVTFDLAHYDGLCQAFGFLMEYSFWTLMLVTTFVTSHLTSLVLFHKNFEKLELFYVLFSCIFPLLFLWVPFLNHRYGPSGAWCWIRTLDFNDCRNNHDGLIEQITLDYGPFIVILIMNLVATVAVSVVLCHKSFRKPAHLKSAIAEQGKAAKKQNTVTFRESTNTESLIHEAEQYKMALKKTIPLLAYPVILVISSWFPIFSRIWWNVYQRNNYALWVAQAVSLPCPTFFLGGAFIVYVIMKKKFTKESISKAASSWKRTFTRKRRLYVQLHNEMASVNHPGTDVFTGEGYTGSSPTTWEPEHESV